MLDLLRCVTKGGLVVGWVGVWSKWENFGSQAILNGPSKHKSNQKQ